MHENTCWGHSTGKQVHVAGDRGGLDMLSWSRALFQHTPVNTDTLVVIQVVYSSF